MDKINGAELIRRILNHPKGSLDRLLEIAEFKEHEWLEFKAALLPKEYILENGKKKYSFADDKNKDDFFWHVARAVISIANTNGGAVILGLDDATNPIGLEASDENNKLKENSIKQSYIDAGYVEASDEKDKLKEKEDCFAREVINNAIKPSGHVWDGKKTKYKLLHSSYYKLIDYKFCLYKGKNNLAIIVDPIPKDEHLSLIYENQKSGSNREVLYSRDVGDIGNTQEIIGFYNIRDFINNREPCQEKYSLLYQKFESKYNYYEAFTDTKIYIHKLGEGKTIYWHHIGLDLELAWDSMQNIFKDKNSLNFNFDLKILLINPEANPNDDNEVKGWRDCLAHNLYRIKNKLNEIVLLYKESGRSFKHSFSFYDQPQPIHGWCIGNEPKEYFLSHLSEINQKWQADAYRRVNGNSMGKQDTDDISLFESIWKKYAE